MCGMSSEREKLLNLILPDGYPTEWEYTSTFNEYLSKLGSLKVDELLKAPNRLHDEHNRIQDQTKELAATNYKTFIETAECSRLLFSQFTTIENKLEKLCDDMPEFQNNCHNFNEKTSGICNLRKLNLLAMTKNAQLLEVLELPQLMRSFINDSLYDDALELATYVRKLNNKHPDIPVFKNILRDVDKAWLLMLHQLLGQLKQDLTLPKCLEIVSHLRRMEVFTELELRLKFLQTRGAWLQQCIKYIPKDDINHHLMKTVELTRVNLFNIITQYRAVFTDEDQHSLKGDSISNNIYVYSWLKDQIAEFLSTLEEDLAHVSSLESIIDQCMYFGLSFSKAGCDFRPLLLPIFNRRIAENFKASVTKSIVNFENDIEKFTLINKNFPSIPWRTKNKDTLQPPDSLLEFYPLAEYLNNILRALNELRLVPSISIIDEVIDIIQKSLIFISKSLLMLYSQEQQAFTSHSKDAFTRLCMSFSDDMIPYIQKCIHIIYPPSQIGNKIGISVQVLQQDKILFLDKHLIIEPISHLLPAKIEPDINFAAKYEGGNCDKFENVEQSKEAVQDNEKE